MIKRWRHIDEIVGDPWMLPIWRSIHEAVNEGRMKKSPKKFSELALYISTKLTMMPRIVKRINTQCGELWEKIKQRNKDDDYYNGHKGRALIIDWDLKYNLLIDLDSLLFELNSCLDLMKEFLFEIYKHTNKKLNKVQKNEELKKIFLSESKALDWYDKLVKHRNFFIHQASPYPAVDLTHEEKYYDLIIMKENIKKFDNQDKFILLSALNKIVHGFLKARNALQNQIIEYIDHLPTNPIK